MGIVLGIDVGGSTTKIVGIRKNKGEQSPCTFESSCIGMLQVRAADQVTSMYGAMGNFLSKHGLKPSDVSKVYLTGVGASFINEQVYDIKTEKVNEFTSIGRGALFLTGKDEALIISMGTGTALVKANETEIIHLGGSGVGGGTIIGLASRLLGKNDVDAILALAEKGDLANIDLSVGDILNRERGTSSKWLARQDDNEVNSLPFDLTASNFGKIKSTASDSDIALGIINMVFETAGMLAVFALKNETIKDVIITGSLAEFPQAETVFSKFRNIMGINFIIPENAVFATAIGATL